MHGRWYPCVIFLLGLESICEAASLELTNIKLVRAFELLCWILSLIPRLSPRETKSPFFVLQAKESWLGSGKEATEYLPFPFPPLPSHPSPSLPSPPIPPSLPPPTTTYLFSVSLMSLCMTRSPRSSSTFATGSDGGGKGLDCSIVSTFVFSLVGRVGGE